MLIINRELLYFTYGQFGVAIFPENTLFKVEINYRDQISAILVNKGVEVANIHINQGSTYTVPQGKTLFILSRSPSGDNFYINGNYFIYNSSIPIILPSGTAISSPYSEDLTFTGYFR